MNPLQGSKCGSSSRLKSCVRPVRQFRPILSTDFALLWDLSPDFLKAFGQNGCLARSPESKLPKNYPNGLTGQSCNFHENSCKTRSYKLQENNLQSEQWLTVTWSQCALPLQKHALLLLFPSSYLFVCLYTFVNNVDYPLITG